MSKRPCADRKRQTLAAHLLWAHVTQRAQQVPGTRQGEAGVKLGQTEIGDPEVAAIIKQQIRWFHVPVDDAKLMGMLQCFRRLHNQPGRRPIVVQGTGGTLRRQFCPNGSDRVPGMRMTKDGRPICRRRWLGKTVNVLAFIPFGAYLADQFGQVLTVNELHGVVVDAAGTADCVDRDDVGVVQEACRLDLVLEASSCLASKAAANDSTLSATRRPRDSCTAS